jgi:hypothetical protein
MIIFCEPIGVKELATIFALQNLMVLAFCFPLSLLAFSCVFYYKLQLTQ